MFDLRSIVRGVAEEIIGRGEGGEGRQLRYNLIMPATRNVFRHASAIIPRRMSNKKPLCPIEISNVILLSRVHRSNVYLRD